MTREEIVERLKSKFSGPHTCDPSHVGLWFVLTDHEKSVLVDEVQSLLIEAGQRHENTLELCATHSVEFVVDTHCYRCAEQRAAAGMQAAVVSIADEWGYGDGGRGEAGMETVAEVEELKRRIRSLAQADGTNAPERERAKARLEEAKWWSPKTIAAIGTAGTVRKGELERIAELSKTLNEAEGEREAEGGEGEK